MKRSKWAGFIGMLALSLAPAVSAERLSMTIRVLDQANLPATTIHKMEKYVENTLVSIDVDVRWIECAANVEACKALRGPNEFWLRVLGQTPPSTGPDQLGFTQPGESGGRGIQCVNVIYPMVEQLSRHTHIEAHWILGAAAAHEIGHLYLGTNDQAHSKAGVMCGIWSRREIELVSIGELNFTRGQGERIRAAMNAAPGF
jgi:hypothetical protein